MNTPEPIHATVTEIESGHPAYARIWFETETGERLSYPAMRVPPCALGETFVLVYEWNGAGYSYLPHKVNELDEGDYEQALCVGAIR